MHLYLCDVEKIYLIDPLHKEMNAPVCDRMNGNHLAILKHQVVEVRWVYVELAV